GPTFTFGPQVLGIDPINGQPRRYTRQPPWTGTWGGSADESYSSFVPSAHARLVSGNLEVNLHASSYRRSAPYAAPYTFYEGDFNSPDNVEIDRSLWGDVKYGLVISPTVQVALRLYGDTFDYQRVNTVTFASGCLFPGIVSCATR